MALKDQIEAESQAYEYLIRNFASRTGKSSSEFYTPKEVAFLMSEIVEPQPGNSRAYAPPTRWTILSQSDSLR